MDNIFVDENGRKYKLENGKKVYVEEPIDVKVPQSEKDVEGLEYITE